MIRLESYTACSVTETFAAHTSALKMEASFSCKTPTGLEDDPETQQSEMQHVFCEVGTKILHLYSNWMEPTNGAFDQPHLELQGSINRKFR